jgi:hypothetical protein
MKVFISWSGERSRAVASILKRWLPDVLQHVDTWMSEHDIDAGIRWSYRLTQVLEECNIGMIVITPENQKAPWLLFEAGALSKSVDLSRVIPFLVDMEPSDVEAPLSQFQVVGATGDGIKKLLMSINGASNTPLPVERIERLVEKWWPDLSKEIDKIEDSDSSEKSIPRRSDREVLNELLDLVRSISQTPKSDPLVEGGDVYVEIDTRPILKKKGGRTKMQVFPQTSVSDLLDQIYYLLNQQGIVAAYTYGQMWLLRNARTGRLYDNIGIDYCRTGGLRRDDNLVILSLELENGDKLLVEPVPLPADV